MTALGPLGSVALISGILYIWLASRAVYAAWYFGILSCCIIAFEDFTRYQLIADGVLQIFYVIMGLIALFSWKEVNEIGHLDIQTKDRKWHLTAIATLMVVGVLIGLALSRWTSASLPMLDTLTSVFAVFATWLMVDRDKSNWLYWMVINAIYLYIYGAQGAWFYVVLSLIYGVMSVYGWIKWQRLYREGSSLANG